MQDGRGVWLFLRQGIAGHDDGKELGQPKAFEQRQGEFGRLVGYTTERKAGGAHCDKSLTNPGIKP